jgi:hypothetical protein
MNETESSADIVTGTVINGPDAPLVDKAVAFFVALNDDKVDKGWDEVGKAALVLLPALAALAATKGRSKIGNVKNLVAPAIALGKLVHDVNQQVTPTHIAQAHEIVETAKVRFETLRANVDYRLKHRG